MAGGIHNPKRHSRYGGYAPLSEINVTPFVDVMLVLLIVFMVTAPLLTVGVPVDLPDSHGENLQDPIEPLVITVSNDGKVYLGDSEINPKSLIARLEAIVGQKKDTHIYIRGDKRIAYGAVMQLMGMIKGAGFDKVALIVELPENKHNPNGS